MAAKKPETAQDSATPAQNISEDDVSYIARVLNVYGRAGTGGDVNVCKVYVEAAERSIYRSVQGPVEVGHLLALREYVRESRRAKN